MCDFRDEVLTQMNRTRGRDSRGGKKLPARPYQMSISRYVTAVLPLAVVCALALVHGGAAASSAANHAHLARMHNPVIAGHHQTALRDDTDRRIVGGSAARGNYMWTTLISRIGGQSITCTGEIIAARWMLTAAHCLLNSYNTGYRQAGPGQTVITYGCLDLADKTKCKTADAIRYIAHPCYTPSNDQDHDDIALIELTQPVEPLGGPFALVNGLNGSVDLPVGSDVYLAGFGAMQGDGSGGRSSKLMEVQVQTVNKDFCVAANPYSYSKQYVNFDHVVCTGGVAGKDSCNGDSGGPATMIVDGEPWLVGLLSKGSQLPDYTPDCAVEDRYGMYTLVHKYGGWIHETIHGKDFECSECPCVGAADDYVHEAFSEEGGAYLKVRLIFNRAAADFTEGSPARNSIITALAAAAGLGTEAVAIVSTEPVRRRQSAGGARRLLGESTLVVVQVGGHGGETREGLVAALSVESVREQLKVRGLEASSVQIVDASGATLEQKGVP